MGRRLIRRTDPPVHQARTKMEIDPHAIGVELSWSFGDGGAECVSIERQRMYAILEAAGYDAAVLPVMDVAAVLQRVAIIAPNIRTAKVAILANPDKDTPRAYGIYYRVVGDESGDDWLCGARIRGDLDRVVCLAPEHGEYEDGSQAIADTIVRRCNHIIGHLINHDLSRLLAVVGGQMGWITRRRHRGGVYFVRNGVPAQQFVDLLMAIADETQAAAPAHRFRPELIEVYASPMSQRTITSSAVCHFEALISEYAAPLIALAESGRVRPVTLDRRLITLNAVIAQCYEYADFLGTYAVPVLHRLQSVRRHYERAIDGGRTAVAADVKALRLLRSAVDL